MAAPRRSRFEILLDILKVLAGNGRLRPTHIMYKANITWQILKENLTYLKQLKAVNEIVEKDGTYFSANQISLEVLAHYSRITEVLTVGSQKSPTSFSNGYVSFDLARSTQGFRPEI